MTISRQWQYNKYSSFWIYLITTKSSNFRIIFTIIGQCEHVECSYNPICGNRIHNWQVWILIQLWYEGTVPKKLIRLFLSWSTHKKYHNPSMAICCLLRSYKVIFGTIEENNSRSEDVVSHNWNWEIPFVPFHPFPPYVSTRQRIHGGSWTMVKSCWIKLRDNLIAGTELVINK